MLKLTDDQLIAGLAEGLSNKELAEKYKVCERTIRNRRQHLILRGHSPEHGMTYTVPEPYYVKGVSTLRNRHGDIIAQWVKSAVDKDQVMHVIRETLSAWVSDIPALPSIQKDFKKLEKDWLCVIPLGDPHIGMLAWGEETGRDFDLTIAEKLYFEAMKRIIDLGITGAECLLINLGDFFHYDNIEGVTARSKNVLDRDNRYGKMVSVGIKILLFMINYALTKFEKVHIINAIGNHDDTGAICLNKFLPHIYANNPRVVVHDSNSVYTYFRFGENLIGVHHGHTSKIHKLPGQMANEKREDWGQTKFHYWLTGHVHNQSEQDIQGCLVRTFRTLTPPDSYGHSGGWCAKQNIKCLMYHKTKGLKEEHTIDISEFDEIFKK